jgi:hypothetical protein
MRSTSSFAAAEGQAAGSGWGVSPRCGVWVVEGRECVGGLDRQLERLVRAFVLDGDRDPNGGGPSAHVAVEILAP